MHNVYYDFMMMILLLYRSRALSLASETRFIHEIAIVLNSADVERRRVSRCSQKSFDESNRLRNAQVSIRDHKLKRTGAAPVRMLCGPVGRLLPT